LTYKAGLVVGQNGEDEGLPRVTRACEFKSGLLFAVDDQV
jgi:hypothetical protein